jgi:mannan endo-1,4-beta-mannosidase
VGTYTAQASQSDGAGNTGVSSANTFTVSNASNGVTATAAGTSYGGSGGQETVSLTNTASITALTITISVAQTTGVSYGSQSNSFPGGDMTQGDTTSGGAINYTWVLSTGQTIPAAYSGGEVYADFDGTGSARVMTGDTWSVTSTSGGIASTLSGTF